MKRLVAAFLLVLAVCPAALAARIDVAVSIAPQKWFVERIAGDLARVTVMVPPGASPHGFEPKPGQMRAVSEADVYLALGLGFEDAWLPRFLAANPDLRVAHTDRGIAKIDLGSGEHGEHGEPPHHAEGEMHGPGPGEHGDGHRPPPSGHGHGERPEPPDAHGAQRPGPPPDHEAHEHHQGKDPHIWLSPALAEAMARNIRDALAQADPEDAPAFDAGLAALVADIEALRAELAGRFDGLARREFMIFHPSWGYFAHEFGLVQLAVEAGGREPSPRDLAGLVDRAGKLGVRAVFVQPQMSRRAAELLAREIGGRVEEADPLAEDWLANMRQVGARLERALKE